MKKCILLLIVCSLLITCQGQKKIENKPVNIILDTDMLTDPEDVNALCLLHAFADNGEARILACVANGHETNRSSGAAIDVINTFYNRPDIPIGTYKGGYPEKNSAYTFLLRDSFPHDVPNDDKLPDALAIYRETLSKQPDHSVVIISVGFLVNIKDLIYSTTDSFSNMNGKDLIRTKVKELVIMGGKFPEGREHNFDFGGVGPATKDVVENWPVEVPITFSGYELGEQIISGKNYKYQLPQSPLFLALQNAYGRGVLQGRYSWDQSAVIYGVRGLSHNSREYWKKQSQGSISVEEDGSNKWLHSPDKNQSYLIKYMNPDSLADIMENYILNATYNAVLVNYGFKK